MSDPLLAELNRMTNHECHLIVIPDWSAKLTILIGGTHEQHFEAFKKRKLHVWECTHLADWCRDEMRHNAAVTLQPTTRPRSQFIYFPTRPNIMKAETVGTAHAPRAERRRRPRGAAAGEPRSPPRAVCRQWATHTAQPPGPPGPVSSVARHRTTGAWGARAGGWQRGLVGEGG